jgi:hypothetical protein
MASKFRGVLLIGHKEVAVEVPFDPAERFGVEAQRLWKGRRGHPVRATIGRLAFESAVVPRSGRFWLLIPDEISARADLEIGAEVSVSIEPRAQ